MNISTRAQHPSVVALTARILAEERALTPQDREARYQRIAALCDGEPLWDHSERQSLDHSSVRSLATHARKTLTPNEERFWRESHSRWPNARFLRYHDVSIETSGMIGAMFCHRPSVWYAPFYHAKSKTIIVIDDRPDFPYRIYEQNWKLYAQHGYSILDFSEDFSCETDDSVWEEAMAMVGAAIERGGTHAMLEVSQRDGRAATRSA